MNKKDRKVKRKILKKYMDFLLIKWMLKDFLNKISIRRMMSQMKKIRMNS